MWHRQATYADVDAVLDNLSQISADEMSKVGIQNRWAVKLRAKMCKDKGTFHAGIKGDKPICIFGAIPFETNTLRTWFIGSDDYFTNDLSTLRGSRRYMDYLAKRFPHFSIESLSRSEHPAVLKWFRAMGFGYVDIDEANGIRKFRYGGKNSTTGKECATPVA